jgi:predicted ATPase/DNA-binding SARP family transcriptional activator
VITVGVLGPLDVRRDGHRLTVPSGRSTEVLVRLALEAGRVVSAERLIEDLWGAAAAGTGRNTLQSKVSQLRRALGEPDRLSSGHGGYCLQVEPDRVDALRVVSLAATAADARRAGDPAATLEAADQALALFRGDVLADAGDGEWLHPHRTRLEELRLALLEDRAAARVDLGAGGDLVAELEQLTAAHPLREGLWSSLITALYRAGRQADALAAYQRVRQLLDDELGIEPGPQLRGLETRILRQAASLAGPAGAPSSASTSTLAVGNLPALGSPLVGRDGDLAALAELLAAHRLVTVVGPAGVGKTRAAIEAARALTPAGGVWLIRLDALDPLEADADAAPPIARSIAETLQLAGGEQALADRLTGAETVLLLDTCEHRIGPVADLVTDLLGRAPTLRVLATSQTPLGLDGEVLHPLRPLSLDDSVTLFAQRAARSRRRSEPPEDAEDADAVRSVCAALDGLPLAIELAAARTKSLSVRDISRRLDDRFTLLRSPAERGPERRRALAAAIGWSYDLLFPDDQRGLWALAVFVDGAPLAAAEHVLAALDVPSATAIDVVDRLVDRSVLGMEPAEDGGTRYRLLDSIRLFALERLRENGLLDTAQAAHAIWFALAADRTAATVRTTAQPGCVAQARAERANLDAALGWAAQHDPALGLRIANGFGWTWVVLGDGVAGAQRTRAALTAAGPAATDADRATALLLAGWLEASAGDVEQAQADLDAAGTLADRLGDERLRADCDRHLAFLHIQQGRPADVLARSAASVATCRRLDLTWETAASLLLGAFGSIMVGDTGSATRDAEEALALLTPIDDSWGMVHAKAMLGAIAEAEHRFDDATDYLRRAVARSQALGFLGQTALHLTTLGRVRQRAGDRAEALDLLTRALAAAARAGDLRVSATARIHLARAAWSAGDAGTARTLMEDNERWYRASGHGGGALLSRCLLASLRAADGDPDATSSLQQVLEEARTAADHETQVLALDALAHDAVRAGDPGAADELLGTADQLAAHLRHVLDDADRRDAAAVRGSTDGIRIGAERRR